MEKLDNLSKILLATGTINYMAAQINAVNGTQKMFQRPDQNAANEFDEVMSEAVSDLAKICEKLADFTNDKDMVAPIDSRITEPALDILLFGSDLVEDDSISQAFNPAQATT